MTPEAQIIALSEACGWKPDRTWERVRTPTHCIFSRGDELRTTAELDNYPADLNAQFKAWQKLDDTQKFAFRNWVMRVALREGGIWAEEVQARFGCECLLRALGKWIE